MTRIRLSRFCRQQVQVGTRHGYVDGSCPQAVASYLERRRDVFAHMLAESGRFFTSDKVREIEGWRDDCAKYAAKVRKAI